MFGPFFVMKYSDNVRFQFCNHLAEEEIKSWLLYLNCVLAVMWLLCLFLTMRWVGL